jgi:hypothetical protein
MATSSTADSATRRDAEPVSGPDDPGTDAESSPRSAADTPPRDDADATSMADRLRTAARIIWASFLALVVVFTLIPVVALGVGAVPFDPPPTAPYFALVGFALVGTAALIVGAIYDV